MRRNPWVRPARAKSRHDRSSNFNELFPDKPLRCYGDVGAFFTGDAEFVRVTRSLRVHGQGAEKCDNWRVGVDGQLYTIQAAILIEKLSIFAKEIAGRRLGRAANQ